MSIPDDEKIKAEEDRRLAQSDIQESQWDSPPVFISDRKGDQLNVTYGGIHAGNVPKYHIVDQVFLVLMGTGLSIAEVRA